MKNFLRLALFVLLFISPAFPASSRPELVLQLGHRGDISDAAFSPDGKVLATASAPRDGVDSDSDGAILLHDVASGAVIRTLPCGANCILFQRDASTLIAGDDNAIRFWNFRTGKLLRSWREAPAIAALSLSRDEKFLAVAYSDRKIILRETATGKQIHIFQLRSDGYSSDEKLEVALSPDGKILAATLPNALKLWRVQDGSEIKLDEAALQTGGAVAFSPEGKFLAAGGALWKRDGETFSRLPKLNGELNGLSRISFSADGKTLFGEGAQLKLWDLVSGRRKYPQAAWTRSDAETSVAAISPDASTLATTEDGMNDANTVVKIWQLKAARVVSTIRGWRWGLNVVRFSRDGKFLTTQSDDDAIRLWNLETLRVVRVLMVPHDDAFVISPDGSLVITREGGVQTMREIRSGKVLWRATGFKGDWSGEFETGGRVLFTRESRDQKAAITQRRDARSGKILSWGNFASDKKILITALFNAQENNVAGLEARDAKTKKLLWKNAAMHGSDISQYALSPDQKTLATCSADWSIKLWSAHSGKILRTLLGHNSLVNGIEFSPDGRVLASAANDWTIRFWHVASGKLLATLQLLPSAPQTDSGGLFSDFLCFTPDDYFTSTPHASPFARWRLGDRIFPFEKYRQQFARADIVRRALRGAYISQTTPPAGRVASANNFDGAPNSLESDNGDDDQNPKVIALPSRANTSPNNSLSQADDFWNEKSYARALELYRAALKNNEAIDRDEVSFRVAVSLGQTQQWDEAIATGKALLETTPNKARVLAWLARLYLQMPQYGWRAGDQFFHRMDAPKLEGDTRPNAAWLVRENSAAALDFFERAKLAAREERDSTAPHALNSEEEIALNFDLAAALPRVAIADFGTRLEAALDGTATAINDSEIWNEDARGSQTYNRAWTLPRKVLFLYNEISRMDSTPDHKWATRALIAKGLFATRYAQTMRAWGTTQRAKKLDARYPFSSLDATAIWRELIVQFPQSTLAPVAQLFIAGAQQNEPEKSLAAYRELIARFPDSPLVSDARATIAQITASEIRLQLPVHALPERTIKMQIEARNISRISMQAYAVPHLEKLFAGATWNEETDFETRFGKLLEIPKHWGKPVKTWTIAVTPSRLSHMTNASTPALPPGAYLVAAQAGRWRYAELVCVSDLALLKLTGARDTTAFTADARSGKPFPNANIIVREEYDSSTTGQVSTQRRASSDARGLFDFKTRGAWGGRNNQAALAWSGANYAFTDGRIYEAFNGEESQSQIYVTTDRPLYRPGQTVHFRVVAFQNRDAAMTPLKNAPIRIGVAAGRGEDEIFKVFLKTSEFGTASGSFILPDHGVLGEYSISALLNSARRYSSESDGAGKFRVEEYKRPEYQVTIQTPPRAARPGQIVEAQVEARYYFGAPVEGAKIHWTVRRETWLPEARLFLQSDERDDKEQDSERSTPIVAEGEARADAGGIAKISFRADDLPRRPQKMPDLEAAYRIEIEATDASRRVVSAQAEVRVARAEYFAVLHPAQNYFAARDTVKIEVLARDANVQPVAAQGSIAVYRLLPHDKELKISNEPIAIDASGRILWTWQKPQSGRFRVAFEGTDSSDARVESSCEIWVMGNELSRGDARRDGIEIIPQRDKYFQGETARVLISCAQPDATLIVAQIAGGSIVSRQVVALQGFAREVSFPVTNALRRNFAVFAACVRDDNVLSAQRELVVPPRESRLKIRVTPDKNSYAPGETATFKIEARDWKNRPARAELSLALFDASLLAIQDDASSGIFDFFYGGTRPLQFNFESHESGVEQNWEGGEAREEYATHEWKPDDLGVLHFAPDEGWGGLMEIPSNPAMFVHGNSIELAYYAGDKMAGDDDSVLAPPVQDAPSSPRLASTPRSTLKTPRLRENFAETALWLPAVITQNGSATARVKLPDSLTTWRADARGVTPRAQAGAGQSEIETRKSVIVRMQAPRFFVERDQVVLSANIHNYLKTDKKIKVSLDASTPLKLQDDSLTTQWIEVKSGEEKRVDWIVDVVKNGAAEVSMTAQSDEDSDAVKMKFPVLVHGAPRFDFQSGMLRANEQPATIHFDLPGQRRRDASTLTVQLNPSLAATMLDALPYLADYPYGCTEQTLSRFVPAVVMQRVLRESGVDLKTLRARAAVLKAQSKIVAPADAIKNSAYAFPRGAPDSRDLDELASQRDDEQRLKNPVYDEKELDKISRAGLARIYDLEKPGQGGWGWWDESDAGDPYMTALVLDGLSQAQTAGLAVKPYTFYRGRKFLERWLLSQQSPPENPHLAAWVLYVLSQPNEKFKADYDAETSQSAAKKAVEVMTQLFSSREKLNAYSQSLLALALWNSNRKDEARVLARNLENTVSIDEQNATARWRLGDQWWRWWNDDVEANAWALRAILKVDPKNKLAPMIVKWLTQNLKSNHWRSTKETANAIYALAEYARLNKELDVDCTARVTLNGTTSRTFKMTRENALLFDNRLVVNDANLRDGDNEVTVELRGRGQVYWSAASEYFSLEEPIKSAGNALHIERRYFKLGRSGSEYSREEIGDGTRLQSGDLIEVELRVEADNDYEYLVFEDLKPAGLEPVALRSGAAWDDGLASNVELRDEKVAFFLDFLPQGARVLRYRMRAEIPGSFHALPADGYAMYAPEVRAISDEARIGVKD